MPAYKAEYEAEYGATRHIITLQPAPRATVFVARRLILGAKSVGTPSWPQRHGKLGD